MFLKMQKRGVPIVEEQLEAFFRNLPYNRGGTTKSQGAKEGRGQRSV